MSIGNGLITKLHNVKHFGKQIKTHKQEEKRICSLRIKSKQPLVMLPKIRPKYP